jgi:DNA primase
MRSETFTCQKAKEIDLVDYLNSLGFRASKKSGRNFWYLSPLRNERTPSFKVDIHRNVWFDFGAGVGGTLIDFGIRYHQCSVKELLYKLEQGQVPTLSVHNPLPENQNSPEKILIRKSRAITNAHLKNYLRQRNISLSVANRYCAEIEFELYKRKLHAIGFKNDLGGYELRNPEFKGGNSPKSITLFQNNTERLLVFEGFFDFLSYHQNNITNGLSTTSALNESFLILNSLAFFEKSRDLMGSYQHIDLFLDRDEAGIKSTEKALAWSNKFQDQSALYKNYKDFNEFLVHRGRDFS